MRNIHREIACLVVLSGLSGWLYAQDTPPDSLVCGDPQVVFACQGDAKLSQVALDGAFSRVPEGDRLIFVRDGAQVDQMVRGLLRAEVVALDAEASGFDQDPIVQQRLQLAVRKELATAWLEKLVTLAPEADYAAMAYEDYLAHPENYSDPATVDVTQILIGTDDRTSGEAEEIAIDLRVRLKQDPTQFDALVVEYSDDPGKASNAGKYTGVKRGRMVKPFEDAAFAMQEVGEISEPVESEFGFHLIRLDARQEAVLIPFGKVKVKAEANVRKKHLDVYRDNYLKRLLQNPIQFPPGSVEVMARRYFGENLEDAPIYTEEAIE